MKKSIFLFFAAILCAMTANATFYYRGNDNGWGGTEMQAAANGLYYYYKDTKAGEFKITNKGDSWDGATQYTKLHNKYNGANITLTGGNGSNCNNPTTNSYILLYQGNNGKDIIVCASTTLPTGLNEVWIKHNWGGSGSWTYKQATDNGDGTFSLSAKYGESGCNLNAYNGENAQWWYDLAEIEVEAGLNKGDDAVFTVNAVTRKISVTKKVSKNLGDITITMNCTQQPKIFFWDVEGKTCAAWPGEDMVAAGANTYTYTFEDVDVDLGVNYKINLKEVNENEWNTGDLHTTTDVTHDVSDLNIPKIVVLGVNGDWGSTNTLTELSNDYLSVSKTISVEEVKTHDIKMHVGDNEYQGGDVVDITRANPSSEKFDKNYSYNNGKFTADIAGDYVFTYTYKTHTLTVTYPELPTPEYKDITITVYAKEVPNIWWWNGGDQCLSTEDLVNPSTGNKYKWQEAPAMEAVVVDGNTWYQKKFENVDVTKGGIKFKLQSADHSTSTTSEVTTTEDKCYDARVIATVTETPCGQLPTGETPKVTYTVEVPDGTEKCYIRGGFDGWDKFHEMELKAGETNIFTLTIDGATTEHKYKYACQASWDYKELNADGTDVADRTWTELDKVEKWGAPAPTYDYYLTGSLVGGWEPKQQGIEKDGELYKATFNALAAGTYEFKITAGDWEHQWNYNNLGAAYEEVSQGVDGEGNPNGNIKIFTEEAKNITVIFDATANKITIEGLTIVTHTYTIAGDAALCGETWNWELAANDMTNNGDGTYTWTKAGVEVNGELSFKVYVDHKSEPAYPAENWVIKPENYEGVGVYDVTITFTESSKEVAVALTKQVVTPTPEVIRTALTAGNYYTICMNKEMEEIQGATLWSFCGKDANFAYLVQENAPYDAGKAYIMYAEAETVSAILTGEPAAAPVANGAIHGTFVPMEQDALTTAGDNIYLVIGNQLRRVDGRTGNSLPANRAYVDIDEITGGAPAGIPANRVRSMPMQPQVATGVDQVQGDNVPTKTIINGQLFILRGEKMYDAQGKLVK